MSFTYVKYPIQKKGGGGRGVGIQENITAVGKRIRSVEFPILSWANVN